MAASNRDFSFGERLYQQAIRLRQRKGRLMSAEPVQSSALSPQASAAATIGVSLYERGLALHERKKRMLEDEQKAIAAAARPLLLSPSLHVSTTSNQGDSGTEAGERDSPGIRLWKRSKEIQKKHQKLREQKEEDEEKRLQRVPVAPPIHFDAIKYQQQLIERARKIDTARKRQQEQAQLQAQDLTFQPTLNTSYQMKKDRPSVTMNAIDRYKEIESSRRVRLAELLQQEEEDLQRDCTFKPQINSHPSHQQRGEFLAESQLRERKKRLQQLLTAGSDSKDDAVVRSLRSAISDTSPSSTAKASTANRSPASALQFSPALSRAASIVGAGGVGVGSPSAAAHGRHEDPDLKGDLEANSAAAVGAVEKIFVAPPAELPESDDDVQDYTQDNDHYNYDDQQEQHHRRGGLKGSAVVTTANSANARSVSRLNSIQQNENQALYTSNSVRSPKFFAPRPSVFASSGNRAPDTPSLRQQLRQRDFPRPASAPARGRVGRQHAADEIRDATANPIVRSRALPSKIAGATTLAIAAARKAAEDLVADRFDSDQPRKKQQASSSLKQNPVALSHNGSNVIKDLPSMLYKDAEFRTLRRQLLGVQQELILEQSATPYVSEKSEELARKSRLDSLEQYYAKFCGGTSELMTCEQFTDAFKRTVYMKGVDASLGRLRPEEEMVIANRIWVILAGESTATIDFETFGKFILEAPSHAGVQSLRTGDAVDMLLYKLVQEFSRSAVKYFRLAQQQRATAHPAPAPEDLYSFKPTITKYVGGRDGRNRTTGSVGDRDGVDEMHDGIRNSGSGVAGSGARAGEIHDRLFREAKQLQQKKDTIRDEFVFEADAECTFQPKINKSVTPSARLHRSSTNWRGAGGWGASQSQGSTPRGGSIKSGGYDSEGDDQGIMRSDFFEQLYVDRERQSTPAPSHTGGSRPVGFQQVVNRIRRATIDKLNRELDQEKVFQYKAPSTARPVNPRLATPRAHQQTKKYQVASEPDTVIPHRSQGSNVRVNRNVRPSSSPPVSISLKSLADSTSPKTRSGGFQMPILFVDVKLKDGSFDRISVHRGDDIGHLSLTFARKHNLDEAAKSKLELLLRRKVADNALE